LQGASSLGYSFFLVVAFALISHAVTFTALANIAGDGPNSRDSVLAAGVIQVARCLLQMLWLFLVHPGL
jgi:hypothetical protein